MTLNREKLLSFTISSSKKTTFDPQIKGYNNYRLGGTWAVK